MLYQRIVTLEQASLLPIVFHLYVFESDLIEQQDMISRISRALQ